MSDAVIIAAIGLVGTITTTVGVMWLKHKFDLADRRNSERENDEELLRKYAQAFSLMAFHIREKDMKFQALAQFAGGDAANKEYALRRIIEIASEPTNYSAWESLINHSAPPLRQPPDSP